MPGRDETHSDAGEQRVFTTGEAAALCKVSQQTIIRCFDSGRLGGFRVPGSRFRRIPREELIRFMRANGIPTDALESSGRRKVLVAGEDPQGAGALAEALSRDGRFEVRRASSAYEAGLITEAFRPNVFVFDAGIAGLGSAEVCRRARARPDLAAMKVVVVCDACDRGHPSADATIERPVALPQAVERVARLAGATSGAERAGA